MKTKDDDLMALCQLWYVTRSTVYGEPMTEQAANALTAFDSYIQDVIERQNL
jgi:hypothetical protein